MLALVSPRSRPPRERAEERRAEREANNEGQRRENKKKRGGKKKKTSSERGKLRVSAPRRQNGPHTSTSGSQLEDLKG